MLLAARGPEETFSFYGSTPSGFDFELGANSREIDPGEWQVHRSATTSSWGHRPTLRLQLKMAGGFLRRKLGVRPALAYGVPTVPQIRCGELGADDVD